MTQPQDTSIAKSAPPTAEGSGSRVTAGSISLAIAAVLTLQVAVYEAANVGGFSGGAFWSWWWDFGSVVGAALAAATLVFGLVGLGSASRSRLAAAAGTAVAAYFLVTRVLFPIFGALLYTLL